MLVVFEVVRIGTIIMQLAAALLALRLVWLSARTRSWMLLAAAMFLLAGTRLLPYVPMLSGQPPTPPQPALELLRAATSALMLSAVLFAGPQMRRAIGMAEELRRERERVDDFLDSAGALIVGLDPEGRVSLVNRHACEVLGGDEREILGVRWLEAFVPAESREAATHLGRPIDLKDTQVEHVEERVRTLNGVERTISWMLSPVFDDGVFAGVVGVGEDVTDRMQREEDLRFRSFLLDSAMDSIIVHDLEGHVLYANEAAYRLRGYTREEFLALEPYGWVKAESIGAATERNVRVLRERGSRIFESRSRRKDGSLLPVEVHISLVTWRGREAVVSVDRDLSERMEAEERIRHMAFYDPLTGLANRRLFLDRLGIALSHAQRSDLPLAVMFLDLDHFKTVNDSLGHAFGDRLLQAVADRLRALMREGDTVARLGGDEFTLLLQDVSDDEAAAVVASKVLDALREPLFIGEHEIHTSCSLGIAVSDGLDFEPDMLLANADTAMYRVKESGRDGYRFFDPTMNERVMERFSLKNELRHALDREELDVYFQPQVRLASGRIVGAEALLRWRHGRQEHVPVHTLISLAEESGLIVPIGEWVLRTACAQNKAWQTEGLPPIRVAVNLSARQVMQADLPAVVQSVLDETGLDPGYLELEITENVAMQDPALVSRTFDRLRALGVRIAIDDFGTGHSSLEYLKRFPVNTLKVAQSFVDDVCDNADSAAIASAIVVLGQNMGLNVIAEGVETSEQVDFLIGLGCNEMQGFLYSRPVPAADFRDLLRSGRRWVPKGRDVLSG